MYLQLLLNISHNENYINSFQRDLDFCWIISISLWQEQKESMIHRTNFRYAIMLIFFFFSPGEIHLQVSLSPNKNNKQTKNTNKQANKRKLQNETTNFWNFWNFQNKTTNKQNLKVCIQSIWAKISIAKNDLEMRMFLWTSPNKRAWLIFFTLFSFHCWIIKQQFFYCFELWNNIFCSLVPCINQIRLPQISNSLLEKHGNLTCCLYWTTW